MADAHRCPSAVRAARPPIPAAVKRALRQRCGFGCVKCGSPVYDYEHLLGWAVTGHDPDQMTLLCPEHHREKSAGRLPVASVLEYNAAPFNGVRSFTAAHPLYFRPSQPLILVLGNVVIQSDPDRFRAKVGLVVDGTAAFAVGLAPDGHPIVELDIRDLDNRPLLRVAAGEMRTATANWDVEFRGTRLVVRRDRGDVVIDVRIDAPKGEVVVESADFALHHVRMKIGRQSDGGGFDLPDTHNGVSQAYMRGAGIAVDELASDMHTAFRIIGTRRAYGAPPVGGSSAFRRPKTF